MLVQICAYVRRHHVGLLAIFLSFGLGTAWAATNLGKNAVKSRNIAPGQVKRSDIAKNAIATGKVADGGLLAADFAGGQLPQGERGPRGPAGQDATKLFAYIGDTTDVAQAFLYYGPGVASVYDDPGPSGSGSYYDVTFTQSVRGCIVDVVPGIGNPTSGTYTEMYGIPLVTMGISGNNTARVQFLKFNGTGTVETSFMIAALC